MKVPIKMILENATKGDTAEFVGKIKKVNEFKENKGKWSIGNQGMIVADDTGEIKVIFSIKDEKGIFTNSIEGKEVVITGTVSEWEGKKNIFGKKMSFTENWEEEDKPSSPKEVKKEQKSLTPEYIRIECLKIAVLKSSGSDLDIIETAKKFERYVTGNKIEGAVNTVDEAVKKAEEKLTEKLDSKKVEKINYIMEIAQENGEGVVNFVKDFIGKCEKSDIKELTVNQLETLSSKIEELVVDMNKIPF